MCEPKYLVIDSLVVEMQVLGSCIAKKCSLINPNELGNSVIDIGLPLFDALTVILICNF